MFLERADIPTFDSPEELPTAGEFLLAPTHNVPAVVVKGVGSPRIPEHFPDIWRTSLDKTNAELRTNIIRTQSYYVKLEPIEPAAKTMS